jgi:hypothetical protein
LIKSGQGKAFISQFRSGTFSAFLRISGGDYWIKKYLKMGGAPFLSEQKQGKY